MTVPRETPRRRLTPRQLELIDRITRPGASNRSVAAELGLSEQTIRNQLRTAYSEYGVHSLAQLVRVLLARPR